MSILCSTETPLIDVSGVFSSLAIVSLVRYFLTKALTI